MPGPGLPPFVYIRLSWATHPYNMPQPRIMGSRMFDIVYGPTDKYPAGRRGQVMLAAWEGYSDPATAGMLVQDGDTVIDPFDYAIMVTVLTEFPDCVVTSPVKLWRKADTDGWVWAHWRGQASQNLTFDPDFFCFNFTYLPRRLLEACGKKGMRSWSFPTVDTRVARVARETGIPVRVARCTPKHMNF